MKEYALKNVLIAVLVLLASSVYAGEGETEVKSFHAGFLYPNGVDVIGYTIEKEIGNAFYRFYTFGFPSLAAIGISYYGNYEGNGLSGVLGAGIGSVLYGSIVYQWKVGNRDYIKLGAGFAAGVAYTGAYPALSYERRFY